METRKVVAALRFYGLEPSSWSEGTEEVDGDISYDGCQSHVSVPTYENEAFIVTETEDGKFIFGEPTTLAKIAESLLVERMKGK